MKIRWHVARWSKCNSEHLMTERIIDRVIEKEWLLKSKRRWRFNYIIHCVNCKNLIKRLGFYCWCSISLFLSLLVFPSFEFARVSWLFWIYGASIDLLWRYCADILNQISTRKFSNLIRYCFIFSQLNSSINSTIDSRFPDCPPDSIFSHAIQSNLIQLAVDRKPIMRSISSLIVIDE